MTAPAAPTIRVRQFGGRLLVTWPPVDPATVTDYNVYVGEAPTAPALEDTIDADLEAQPNGTFMWWSPIVAGIVSVYVTALNVGAEESVPSATRTLRMSSDSDGAYMVLDQAVDTLRRIDL